MPKKDNRLIIYEKTTNLIIYSKNLLNKYPKSERFDLCADIKNTLYQNKTLDLHQAAVSFQSWKGHAMHETNQITVKSAIQKCEWIYKEQSQY